MPMKMFKIVSELQFPLSLFEFCNTSWWQKQSQHRRTPLADRQPCDSRVGGRLVLPRHLCTSGVET